MFCVYHGRTKGEGCGHYPRKINLSRHPTPPSVKICYWPFQGGTSAVVYYFYFCHCMSLHVCPYILLFLFVCFLCVFVVVFFFGFVFFFFFFCCFFVFCFFVVVFCFFVVVVFFFVFFFFFFVFVFFFIAVWPIFWERDCPFDFLLVVF